MVESRNTADSISGKPAMFFHYSDRFSVCNRSVPMYCKNQFKLVQKGYKTFCCYRLEFIIAVFQKFNFNVTAYSIFSQSF